MERSERQIADLFKTIGMLTTWLPELELNFPRRFFHATWDFAAPNAGKTLVDCAAAGNVPFDTGLETPVPGVVFTNSVKDSPFLPLDPAAIVVNECAAGGGWHHNYC